MTGKLITLEGIEGVGKSTIQSFVIETLIRQLSVEVIRTREPGGTPLAESIRRLVVSMHDEPVHSDTELLLMFAARAQHVQEVIFPALTLGKWVVSDRFVDATYAYQGAGRGVDTAKIDMLSRCVLGDFKPDLVIVLDAPVEVGMRRAHARQTTDRFEEEAHAFFERVRQCYLDRAAADPARYNVVNAALPLSEVKEQVSAILEKLCHTNPC
ncbi:MAG: dTMP kinase [Gammaproteobacteria bacterium]